MTIKTFDAIELVKKQLAQTYSRYPEGSLSPRDVIATIPIKGDIDKLAFDTNSKITHALYKKAEDFMKSELQKKKPSGFTAVSDIKPAIDDSKKRAEELSSAVIDALEI